MNTRGFTNNSDNIDIPVHSVVAERPALRAVLESIQHHRITLVSAPPGYGKTTAIAHFIRSSALPAAWHSIQERERDLPALFWHSLQALEFIAPGISVAAGNLTNPDECASYIADYLREHLTKHAIYVMDDLHYIAAAPQVERWLRELVRHLPPTCHLILISRALPDLPLAELIARGDVLAIGQDQLKFTANDASALALKVGANLPEAVLQARVKHLEGWPIGVAMSLRPLPDDLEIGLLRGSGGPEALFDALANGILKSLPPVLSDFLLTSSTVSRVNPKICAEVLGLPHGVASMTDIVRRNLFVSQVSGGLMLHRLFRNFLQRRLQQSDPERFLRLHNQAADWHRNEGEDDEAFQHYMAARRIDEALKIVERTHSAYYQQGNMETLLGWRSSLGHDAEQVPQFIYTCAMILTDRYMYTDALQELDCAESGFEARGDAGWVAEVRLQRAMIHIWRGEYETAYSLTRPIAENRTLKSTTRGRAKHLLALAEMVVGDLQTAITHLQDILPLFEETNDSYYVSGILQDLAIAHTQRGDMDAASHCLQRLVAIRRTLGQANGLALALNNLGCHYHQIGDYDLAQHTLEEGIRIIAQTTNRRAESYIHWSMGDLQRDLANDEEAIRLYESAYELSSGAEPFLQQSVALSMATFYRWKGDFRLAIRLVSDVYDELRSTGNQSTDIGMVAQAHLITLDILLNNDLSRHSEAKASFASIASLSTASGLVQIALLAAIAALLCKDEEMAAAYLRQCTGLCERGIGRNIIAAEIVNSPVLKAYIERKPEFRTLQSTAGRLNSIRGTQAIVVRPSATLVTDNTYSLRVLTLGEDVIERDGVPVSTAEWRSSRAKEFFLYLLFQGARNREELSLAFWPDSSSSRVRSNFHTTLYRARRALGENVILFDNDLYRINPAVSVWCDAQVFSQYVKQAQLLSYADVRADDLYRKAIDYYRGDFLNSLDAEWITPHREALHELYISALIGAGHCARTRHDFDGAVTLFKRVLKIDPYREEAYRALFTCYAGMGELSNLLRQYNLMSSIFESDLGILPSPETHAHVQQLTQRIS